MSRLDSVLPVPAAKPNQPTEQSMKVYPPPRKLKCKSIVGVEKVTIDFLPTGEQRYTITVYNLQDKKRLPQIAIRPGHHIAVGLLADQPEGPFNAKK